jgi:hypothetical protein
MLTHKRLGHSCFSPSPMNKKKDYTGTSAYYVGRISYCEYEYYVSLAIWPTFMSCKRVTDFSSAGAYDSIFNENI